MSSTYLRDWSRLIVEKDLGEGIFPQFEVRVHWEHLDRCDIGFRVVLCDRLLCLFECFVYSFDLRVAIHVKTSLIEHFLDIVTDFGFGVDTSLSVSGELCGDVFSLLDPGNDHVVEPRTLRVGGSDGLLLQQFFVVRMERYI